MVEPSLKLEARLLGNDIHTTQLYCYLAAPWIQKTNNNSWTQITGPLKT